MASASESDQNDVKCIICHEKFDCEKSLRVHFAVHVESPNFKCTHCPYVPKKMDYVSRTVDLFFRHVKSIHRIDPYNGSNANENFNCKHCNKVGDTQYNYKVILIKKYFQQSLLEF